MSALRVLHVCQPVEGGTPVVVQQLMDGQAARGVEVALACPPSEFAEALAARHPVSAWPASTSPGPSTLSEINRLQRIISETKPHIVHLHSSKAGLVGRLAVRGSRPVVFQPHAWSFLAVTGVQRAMALRWERIGARWADATICVSRAERAEGLESGLPRRRVYVIPNAVDTRRFIPMNRSEARTRLGLSTSQKLAVFVGRLSTQKGVDILLECWRAVKLQLPDAELAIVGDGPDRLSLENRLGQQSGVSFLGASKRVVDWYGAADVVVVPSRWEGMALVPLEAMACERSVVGFDVAGISECLGPVTPPALVPPGDMAGLAAALVRRLTDPQLCRDEGLRHLQYILDAPGWDCVVEATTRIYRQIVRQRQVAG